MTTIANHEQYEAWNGESGERWVASADRRDEVLAPVARVLLEVARPAPGERVLDVGCGCGATTLEAGERVGPDGAVTGLDLSAPMLAVARRRIEHRGVANVELVQADAQTYRCDPPVDLVLSRFGTMFFADPDAAFANLARCASPGARLCLATWQAFEQNEWLTLPASALAPFTAASDADPAALPMFALADPGTVTRVLEPAGFEVALTPVSITMTLGGSVDEAVDYLADSGPGRLALDAVGDEHRREALAALGRALAPRTDAAGVHLGAAIWLIEGRLTGRSG